MSSVLRLLFHEARFPGAWIQLRQTAHVRVSPVQIANGTLVHVQSQGSHAAIAYGRKSLQLHTLQWIIWFQCTACQGITRVNKDVHKHKKHCLKPIRKAVGIVYFKCSLCGEGLARVPELRQHILQNECKHQNRRKKWYDNGGLFKVYFMPFLKLVHQDFHKSMRRLVFEALLTYGITFSVRNLNKPLMDYFRMAKENTSCKELLKMIK